MEGQSLRSTSFPEVALSIVSSMLFRFSRLPVTFSGLGPRASSDPEGLIAVGWDVAAVDLPYISHYLPRLARLLSRQTVDLNAVCFTIAGDASLRWKSLRRKAEKHAEEELGRADWHDAGFDAAAALFLALLEDADSLSGNLVFERSFDGFDDTRRVDAIGIEGRS